MTLVQGDDYPVHFTDDFQRIYEEFFYCGSGLSTIDKRTMLDKAISGRVRLWECWKIRYISLEGISQVKRKPGGG
jgi:hypothetical protein